MLYLQKLSTAILLILFLADISLAQPKPDDPVTVKSTLIISFIKYLEWNQKDILPEDDSDLIIGILMDENETAKKYVSMFEDIKGIINNDKSTQQRLTKNHPIEIKHFTSPEEMTRCHILIITSRRAFRTVNALKEQLQNYPTLLIADFENFAKDMGGHINFYLSEKNVRFDINLKALNASGIQVRSSLLKSGRRVGD